MVGFGPDEEAALSPLGRVVGNGSVEGGIIGEVGEGATVVGGGAVGASYESTVK